MAIECELNPFLKEDRGQVLELWNGDEELHGLL